MCENVSCNVFATFYGRHQSPRCLLFSQILSSRRVLRNELNIRVYPRTDRGQAEHFQATFWFSLFRGAIKYTINVLVQFDVRPFLKSYDTALWNKVTAREYMLVPLNIISKFCSFLPKLLNCRFKFLSRSRGFGFYIIF